MNEELRKKADVSYRLYEKQAADYFESLAGQLAEKTYALTLTKDFKIWVQNRRKKQSALTLFIRRKGKPYSLGYDNYIKFLDYTGELDNYLDRSISYIYMRDLGKSLDSRDTQNKIQRTVNDLKKQLTRSKEANGRKEPEMYSMAGLYRLAQKEGVELTLIWVIKKLKVVSANIPDGMDAGEAKRKLIKLIAGVIMHQLDDFSDDTLPEERTRKLDEAIRLGYSYGLTYPFIDDLLDSNVLNVQEKNQYTDFIRTTLLTGSVPSIETWTGSNKKLIQFIHTELNYAFHYIKAHQSKETSENFFNQAYVFFQSQEVDRTKDLANTTYSNEELFIPVILKSASSRLIVRSVISAPEDEGFDNRTFYYGIYNQLADDFTDMFDDLEAGSVTPYTYYIKYHDKRPDLINPFALYWTVIAHLIHNVYHSDSKTREVILSRAINSQKRFKNRIGKAKYDEVMALFRVDDQRFNPLIQKIVRKAENVDFFDKLLRDHIINNYNEGKREKEDFLNTIETVRIEINNMLPIANNEPIHSMKEPIVDAANFSLTSGGKRLRPIMTWFMGVHEFGLESSHIAPLLKSLEYMHTASLIYDDLPSQDNAPVRRGRPTLHEVHNTAVAELTGLYLTQKAVEEQTTLEQFDSKRVLQLIRYSSRTIVDMCKGQALDLESKEKQLTLEQLNTICFYKTGLAFEASLVMPAILAGKQESEIKVIKKYAYHAGIAFQIKDDLLDTEGSLESLGKPAGRDIENKTSTFVTVLGANEAKKAMWEHYCLATEAIEQVHHKTNFLKHFLNYIVNRDN